MGELVHHYHLHGAETEPLTVLRFQTQLDDFAGVEIAAHELAIRNVFFECHHTDVVRSHYRVAYCSDTLEEVLGEFLIWSGQWLDEIYKGIWPLGALIQALKTKNHGRSSQCGGGQALALV